MSTQISSQPQLLSQLNQRTVLQLLQTNGPISRAEVARLAGITRPTVSKAVSSLLRSGLIEEYDAPENSRGRPAKKLRLAVETAQVLGLVIDSPTCCLIATGLDGTVECEAIQEFKTPKAYEQLLDKIATLVTEIRSLNGVRTLGVGISMPGLYDYQAGRSILSPNVPITNDRCLGADLSQRLDLECVVLQESDALCLAERHYGLSRGVDDFAMLDASTGIGLGVLTGSRLLKGSNGLAGEIGHLPMVSGGIQCGCGRTGCLETLASDTALARMVSKRVGRDLDMQQIIDLVAANELDVAAELDAVSQQLTFALVTVINLFNPKTLFVHSRMFDLDALLFEQLIERTQAKALAPSFRNCRIERARGSKHEGALAGILAHLTDARVSQTNSHSLKVL